MVLALFYKLILTNFTQMLSMTLSGTNSHFGVIDSRSGSQLHMAWRWINFSDYLVSGLLGSLGSF